jgi:fructuronate reductase
MSQPCQPQREQAHSRTAVVHLGLGAFFRAHGAPLLQAAASGVDEVAKEWGVVGVSLRSSAVRDVLSVQDFVYTTVAMAPAGMEAQQNIEIINDVLVAPEDPQAVLAVMADPAVRFVSLTVTEKGYCRGAGDQPLDLDDPDVRHDLGHDGAASDSGPRTAPGFIVQALARRRDQGIAPFTLLSLDNLPGNGRVLRAAVLAMAGRPDPGLADWIAREVRFPCSMVDRIVPATTPDLIAQVEAATGMRDEAVVAHEPFFQWVLEDDFGEGPRPAFEDAGVQLVVDVEPFERMKLRMLNGTHSALAYIGTRAGHETVAEAMADPAVSARIEALWSRELAPSLIAPPGTDLGAYARALKARYQNPNIRHRLDQIAMDGSQKLPPRILDPLFENLAAGRPIGGLLDVVAAWMQFVERAAAQQRPLADPLADSLLAAALEAGGKADALVTGLLAIEPIFAAYRVDAISAALIERLTRYRPD